MKRVKSFLLALVMMVLSVCTAFGDDAVWAADGITLKLHYNRPDGNYSGWMAWLWAEGQGGADYQFAEEDGDMVATMEVPTGTTSIGYIVKTADWSKDVDADQFIDITEVISGTVHYYVESGVAGGEKVLGDDAVIGTRVKSAVYDEATASVTVTMTGVIDEADIADAFTIARAGGEAVEITSIEASDEELIYIVKLASPLDEMKKYNITYDGSESEVMIPNPYSTEKFENAYTYDGDDLGATYTPEETTFKVWAPTAEAVSVNLYATGSDAEEGAEDIGTYAMEAAEKGVWELTVEGDLICVYYTYTVSFGDYEVEACDPYARTTGVNGDRAMVINLDLTDPEGWEEDSNPHAGEAITDAILYETHVRDASIDASSGVDEELKGTFLGMVQSGTKTEGGVATGLDHMVDLGITHLHILPFYDYGSVDETGEESQYNWGYDPKNYNVPEGSYSTDPYNGSVRVHELKQTVKTLHENGISVVMDVVYNHVYNAEEFCFNQIVPGYFSRINDDGSYSNGSGCGNDTASERSMVSKYIVDSVKYWADEYHIDGFRFDLVGLIDTQTINTIIEEVHKTHPDVIFYGEGWTMSTDVTKEGYLMATQVNSAETPEFAYFNDVIRDALKGSVFDQGTGFVSGKKGMEETIANAFLAQSEWCHSPSQTVNYAACHDNNTLFDRLQISRPGASREDLIKMNNLAAAIYMTSEGIPFVHAGEELLRSKPKEDGTFDHNSYKSGDEINGVKWDSLEQEDVQDVYNYYKGLIAFRKAHDVLRLTTAAEVDEAVTVLEDMKKNVVGIATATEDEEMYLFFNANDAEIEVELPEGEWDVYINDEKAGTEVIETITDGTATINPISALVIVKAEGTSAIQPEEQKYTGLKKEGNDWVMYENGVVTGNFNSLVFYNNNWFYVKNSKVDFGFTGLCKYNGNWFYVNKGVVDFTYTGLAKNAGNWFYVKKGVLDWSYTGLCKYNGSWFYVKGGILDWSYTGLCNYNGSWWYVSGGKVNFGATGLCKYNGSWWYVASGKVDFGYTGLCKYNGSWWYVSGGKVNFGATGLCKYNGSWWYVSGGKVNFGYTGLCKYNGSWWYVEKGMLNFGYTGLCKYNGSWFYVKGGILDWNYTGLCKYGSNWYYVEKGVLNWKYTGYTNYGGSKWYVQSGVMIRQA